MNGSISNATTERLTENFNHQCSIPKLPSLRDFSYDDDIKKFITIMEDLQLNVVDRKRAQNSVELLLINKGTCSDTNPSLFDDARIKLFTVDDKKLSTILDSSDGLNANLHANISCLVNAIIYNSGDEKNYNPLTTERIRNWFKNLHQIGTASYEGYALSSSFSKETNLFVLKTPRSTLYDDLLHETLIGFYALNPIRELIPNFMYVYGYTQCSPSVMSKRKPITWCSSDNSHVSYMIIENITNSQPLGEFLLRSDIDAIDFLAVFAQILNALNIAHKKRSFTHYDLHDENIVVKEYKELVAIPFYGSFPDASTSCNIQGYIATKYIPFIIDYGFSTINISGVGFGKIGYEKYGITNEPFPMFDVYKLLGFLGQRLRNTSDIFPLVDTLFSFFGEGPLLNRVLKRLENKKDLYRAPEKYRSLTYDDYINWMLKHSGLLFPIHLDLNALINNGVIIPPFNSILDSCRFYQLTTSESLPANNLEFCDAIISIMESPILSDESKNSYIDKLNADYSASDNFDNQEAYIYVLLVTAATEMENIKFPPVTGSLMNNVNFTKKYRDQLLLLLKLKDISFQLTSFYRSSICALQIQGSLDFYQDKITDLIYEINVIDNFIADNKDKLEKYLFFIKNKRNLKPLSNELLYFWSVEYINFLSVL